MNKKIMTYLVIFSFMLSFVGMTQQGSAALENIKEGDTIYYKVSKYSVPLDQILPSDAGIDPADIQLDLSGSIIGLKVMKKHSDGTFVLNSFVILGKDIKIPFPDDTDTEVTSIFGTELVIPAGIGFMLGFNIPGSDLVSGGDSGLPVYIEPTKTAEYTTMLDEISPGPGVTISTDDTSDDVFKVTIEFQNTQATGTIVAEWFKSGDNAGLFKSLDASASVLIPGATDKVNLAIAFTFDKKDNLPLPSEIVNKEMQTYSIKKANFDLTFSGVFADAVPQHVLDNVSLIKSNLTALVDEDVARFKITEVDGLFYKTDVDVKNITANAWESAVNDQWFNGFTGSPVSVSFFGNPSDSGLMSVPAIFPYFAPGITPDWTAWQASLKLMDSVLGIIETTVTSSTAASSLIDFGLTVDKFSTVFELRQSGNFKYFYSDSDLILSYDASKALLDNRPNTFTGEEKADLNLTVDMWEAYTNEGLFSGAGYSISVKLDVSSFPLNSTLKGDGTVELILDLEIKNNGITEEIPDVSQAEAVPPPPGIGDGGLIGASGFEILPVLMVLISVPIIKRRNH